LIDPVSPPPDRTQRLRRAALGLASLLLACAVGLASLRGRSADVGADSKAPALPRFQGPLAGGGQSGSDALVGRRALLIVFAPGSADLPRARKLLGGIAGDAREANIALMGVAVGADPDEAARSGRVNDFEFPIVADPRLEIARKLGFERGSTRILIVDAESRLAGGFALDENEEFDSFYAAELRRALHLRVPGGMYPELGVLPIAPPFEVSGLDGGALSSRELKGKVVVLMFFQPTCPHCHQMLQFFKKFLAQNPTPDLAFVPVSASEQKYVIEQMVDDLELDFPVYVDSGRALQKAFEHRLAVPDMLVIDREGRITTRHTGAEPRLQALLTLEIRAALGAPNPILLDKQGYSGADFCRACHTTQHATWAITTHAFAFETLVEHGADRDPECLPCHTVGWNEKGGYSLERPAVFLEGVQCENCHGRGGPHQSPEFATEVGFERACLRCHNEEHSLRFSFAERLPLVSHAAGLAQQQGLSVQERFELLRARDKRQRTLFVAADYVGSARCQSCHAAEHAQWAGTAHARALATLEHKDQRAECQKCHTTGFGDKTGWPAGSGSLDGGGCESCHGPGGRHVAAAAEKRGTILRLADKCDSCVILQICGSCHDDANDPGFEFELENKLARIRHAAAAAP